MIVEWEFRRYFGLLKYEECGNFISKQMSRIIHEYANSLEYPRFDLPLTLDSNMQITGKSEQYVSVIVSSDGRSLFAGSLQGNLVCKDLIIEDAHCHQWEAHQNRVSCLAVHPSGLLASGSWDRIRVWNKLNLSLIHNLQGPERGVNCLDFDHNGRYLASSSNSSYVRLYSMQNGQLLKKLDDQAYSVRYFGDEIITVNMDKSFQLYDSSTLERKSGSSRSVFIRGVKLNKVKFNCDGSMVALLVEDGFALYSWPELKEQQFIRDILQCGKFHPCNPHLFAVAIREERMLSILDARIGEYVWNNGGHFNVVSGICFTPDGSRMISVSAQETARVWNLSQESFLCV